MSATIQTVTKPVKLYPVRDLATALYGYSPNSSTLSRWCRGPNNRRLQLSAVMLSGKWHFSETDLIAFVESTRVQPMREPLTTIKAPSAEARAKRIEKAKAELEKAGI